MADPQEPEYRVTVCVPYRVGPDLLAEFFAAVADAAHDWKPAERDNWDVNVVARVESGNPVAERDQLRYERRLLGVARMVLDLVAAGDASRWDEARREAADVAQRITDEIGHPVTDEPALGPDMRKALAQVQELRAELAVSWPPMARVVARLDEILGEVGDLGGSR